MPAESDPLALHVVSEREYFTAILEEKDRALSMAETEREKAASALRGEQQRAEDRATAEREKAAENLRVELARAIKEGDDRLREHIANQVQQINAALVSADKLEMARVAALAEKIESTGRLIQALADATTVAGDKFEESVKARFVQVNEFRASLDDLSKQMATRRELETMTVTLTERNEEQNKAVAVLRSRIDSGPEQLHDLKTRADLSQGQKEGSKVTTATFFAGLGGLATIIGLLVVFSNIITKDKAPAAPATVTVTVPSK